MSKHSDIILGLAERVTDGTAVDWTSEMNKTPELDGELSELQNLDRIRSAHEAFDRAASTELFQARVPPDGQSSESDRKVLFRWGKLEALEYLGEGAFGEVYRAYDPALQTHLALKLRKEAGTEEDTGTARFLSEARRLARVRHPNVLIVHGVGTHDRRAGIWTEFLHGKTLEECLADRGPWSGREAAIVGLDLCRALAAVHAAGVIHRDVKTTNVMRETGGRIVLMDFGSGGELPPQGRVGTTAHIHGTPLAMAPEQLSGIVAGPSTDIYGLGVLLYRLVTKSFPVEANTIGELQQLHAQGERTRLRDRRPDLPSDFVQLVERAIEPKPEDRFQTTGEMELALSRALVTMDERRKRFWELVLESPFGKVALSFTAAAVVFAIGWGMYGRLRTASPPLVTPPPVTTPKVLTAAANLYRRGASGDQRLTPGARVSPGDRLYLTVRGSDTMYVYVVDEDETGKIYVLFPNPELSPANPLVPGREHRLPRTLRKVDLEADWKISSAGGKETITAIATRTSIPEIEEALAKLPKATAGPVPYAEVDGSAFRSLRGIGSIATGPGPDGGARGVSEALKQAAGRDRSHDEPWIWQMELKNPKPSP
jgi:hypothetical protein